MSKGLEEFAHNRIIFGAPGTGKSFFLDSQISSLIEKKTFERDVRIENEIRKTIQDLKAKGKEDGACASYIGWKYCSYFTDLEKWISNNNQGNRNDYIKSLFSLNAKQPEIIVSAYKGALIDWKNIPSCHERVTFHPSYSYANFVGTYKPVKDEKGNGQITYEFVEGPFIRILRQALNDPQNNYLLIIEEINRANVTAVFGDVFQLLDRDSNNISQYEVAASEDLRKHLLKNGVPADKATVLKIPENMYIWATMNSADQGVQPLDTAFKRRWEFEYLNINNGEDKIDESMKDIKFPNQTMDWNLLRHLINNRLSANYNINEDKLLGPFFIKKGNLNNNQFINAFKSKVLMYLFEDVCKINPKPLFAGINDEGKIHFSKVVEEFDKNGLVIFDFSEAEKEAAETEILKNKAKTEAADAE